MGDGEVGAGVGEIGGEGGGYEHCPDEDGEGGGSIGGALSEDEDPRCYSASATTARTLREGERKTVPTPSFARLRLAGSLTPRKLHTGAMSRREPTPEGRRL